MTFELQVALRYLRAKRKESVISVITVISILGVTTGVAALVVALAINAGFHVELQTKLLGAQPHISIMSKDGGGIPDFLALSKRIGTMNNVVAAAPSAYQLVLVTGSRRPQGVFLKGIIPEMETHMSALAKNIVKGDLKDFNEDAIIIGKELATNLGADVGDSLLVVSPTMTNGPTGPSPRKKNFTVAAIFSSGLYDFDNGWIYVPLSMAQVLMGLPDNVVTNIDVKIRETDLDRAPAIAKSLLKEIGNKNLEATDWTELNRSTFQALKLERLVMFMTIGLIVMVAAMNIVAMLTMMVLEKTRDIAILLSMGATTQQIRKVFIWQGVIIGVVGAVTGVIAGNIISFVADRFHLVHLPQDVYAIAWVPFRANPLDSVIIAVAAILVSLLATLYPSASAARLQPVVALRYE